MIVYWYFINTHRTTTTHCSVREQQLLLAQNKNTTLAHTTTDDHCCCYRRDTHAQAHTLYYTNTYTHALAITRRAHTATDDAPARAGALSFAAGLLYDKNVFVLAERQPGPGNVAGLCVRYRRVTKTRKSRSDRLHRLGRR